MVQRVNYCLFVIILKFQISLQQLQDEDSSFLTVNFMGDIMIGRRHLTYSYSQLNEGGISSVFESVKPIFLEADLNVANLETPLSKNDECDLNTKKTFGFYTNPDFLEEFAKINLNIFTIANNHILDCKVNGLHYTISALEQQNFTFFGAGPTLKDASKPKIIIKKGIKIGFLAYSNIAPLQYPKYKSQGYVNHLTKKNLEDQIPELRSQVDILIIIAHCGQEHSNYPSTLKIETLRKAINLGADLVIAHHPHVLNGIETYKGKYIVYSLGNFVFDQLQYETMKTIIFQCKISKNRIYDAKIIPILISQFAPKIATGKMAQLILADVATFSENFKQLVLYDDKFGYLVKNSSSLITEKITKDLEINFKKGYNSSQYYSYLINLSPGSYLNYLHIHKVNCLVRVGIDRLLYGDFELNKKFQWIISNQIQITSVGNQNFVYLKTNHSIQNLNELHLKTNQDYSLVGTINSENQEFSQIKIILHYYLDKHPVQNSLPQLSESISYIYDIKEDSPQFQLDFSPPCAILSIEIVNLQEQVIWVSDLNLIEWQLYEKQQKSHYKFPNNHQFIQVIASDAEPIHLQYQQVVQRQ